MSNLVTLSEHTIDVDLLPQRPVVLDVGCRFFSFAKDILVLRPEAKIVAMDPDPDMYDPQMKEVLYLREALVGCDCEGTWYRNLGADGAANQTVVKYEDGALLVPHRTIAELSMETLYWDVVKLDCEGSEFEILENWPGPIAAQITVEFHDFLDRSRWDKFYFESLFASLVDYEVVQHPEYGVGSYSLMSHWNSLLVLKG